MINFLEGAMGSEPKSGAGAEKERKQGSTILAFALAIALFILALAIWITDFHINDHAKAVNIFTCIFFGGVLFWWAVSWGKAWGIGFETITMSVTVILAVIAILTLTSIA